MLSASKLSTNIFVTGIVALLVVFLPLIDRAVCRAAGINIQHGLDGHSKESRLLRLRRFILVSVFGVYLLANVYLVFFSRSASEDYLIHVDPLNDLINSVKIDSGILGILKDIYTQGLSEGFSHIHVESKEDIAQIYMNIMLYVPMGYLLPYISEWCRTKVKIRPVMLCFLFSFVTENLQLVFKRGFYDIDDLLSNTFGGYLGQVLYILLAYVVEHPDWRKDLKSYRKWRRRARKRTLYPFANKIGMARTTLLVGSEDTVTDFYVRHLGFRPIKQIIYEDSDETDFLLQIGSFQLELIYSGQGEIANDQYLTLSVKSIVRVRKRLIKNGFDMPDFLLDPYTNQRMLCIDGPDKLHITFIEA